MAGIQSYWEFCDDFIQANASFLATPHVGSPWDITDTSSAGTPTYTAGRDHGETAGVFAPGVAQLAFDSQAEIQNVCLSFGDALAFDINSVQGFECRLRFVATTGSAKDSATTLAWGLAGDRNDAIDSIAGFQTLFRLAAASTSMAVVCESYDGATNNDDVATGQSMTDLTWHRFKIDFSNGLTDVRYFMSDAQDIMRRVAAGTTFSVSNYGAGVQPYFQLQKTADANTDAIQIDYVKIWGRR